MRLVLALLLLAACHPKTTQTTAAVNPKEVTKKEAKPAPFVQAPLASLPDLGALLAADLGKPISALKKLCPPPKKNSDVGIACVCFGAGEESGVSSALNNDSASCAAPTLAVEAPFTSVQFIGVQDTGAPDEDGESSISADFSLLLQTKKGLYTSLIGSSTLEPGLGYGSSFTLNELSFVDVVEGGDKELWAIFNEETSTFSDSGQTLSADGWLVLCGVGPSQKPSCTAPTSLGASQAEGYQLLPKLEGGHLFLVETSAQTPPELKKRSGKYTPSFP
jgi:hypothetical protein